MKNWIFLRGLVRESGHWGDFVPVFQSHMPHAQVHLLDLPGNGTRHAGRSPTHIHAMVEACRRQLQAAGVAPPYALLALSMGGMVAVEWAHRYPQEVDRAVLMNTSMRPFSAFYQRLQPRQWAGLARLLIRRASGLQWERAILQMTTTQPHPDVVPVWLGLRQARPVSTRNALRQLWAAARYHAPAVPPPVPLLALASALDALVSVQCSRAMARAWNVPLLEHPQAGHDLSLDDPQWVVQQVHQWLQESDH
jgi:pimeloyl-ACP methyl ester carboxylesterase